MGYYFSKEFTGPPFELFYGPHLIALAIICLAIGFLFLLRRWDNPELNRTVRWAMAAILVLQEIAYHGWNVHIGEWTLQKMLPFHFCSLFVWLSAFMLLTKSRRIYDFAFFIGISGALQAVMTPDISGTGFPHFRFFQVFVSHGAIILSALYMTVVEKYRPTWRSLGRVLVWINIYALFVFLVNAVLGSNYLFIARKPETASLFDLLGPWPVYILGAEAVALVMFVLLYLPFAVFDIKRAQRPA